MSCILHLRGEGFDVTGSLAYSGITAYQVWDAGEPDAFGRERPYPGCKVKVSDAEFSDLEGQVKDAIDFLT